MSRVKFAVARHKRHKKVLGEARGKFGGRRKLNTVADDANKKALSTSTATAGTRSATSGSLDYPDQRGGQGNGMTYSSFIDGLTKSGVALDREGPGGPLAVKDPQGLGKVVEVARTALR